MTAAPITKLVEGINRSHPASIGRAITMMEGRGPGFVELGDAVWRAGGRGRVIGVTGAPGSGKSTLTGALAHELRARSRSVGVIAVDPSSTISGGALLGDRIRMGAHACDDGVYIRSLSSRGALGGVSRATVDAVAVLDAAGFDDIIVETVGVGQADVDIVRIADTILVVSVPGLGDEIQMLKAGLLELADLHVVNKADRPDVHKLVSEITSMLTLGPVGDKSRWAPVVLETVATTGAGVAELLDAIDLHTTWRRSAGRRDQSRFTRAEARVREIAKDLLGERMRDPMGQLGVGDVVAAVARRELSPYRAALAILDRIPAVTG